MSGREVLSVNISSFLTVSFISLSDLILCLSVYMYSRTWRLALRTVMAVKAYG